MLRCINNI